MKGPQQFQGFADPPKPPDFNAPSWGGRVEALAEARPEEWARYGPYSSNKTASYAVHSVRRSVAKMAGYEAEATYAQEGEEFYVYLRARTTNRNDSTVTVLRPRAAGGSAHQAG